MLLCDLHIHTSFSDGKHSLREVVDIYGQRGFDAIAITDHLCEKKSLLGKAAKFLDKTLNEDNFEHYIEAIHEESERAEFLYGMKVIPGVEFTKNSLRHDNSAHVLALGLEKFIDPDQDILSLLREIRHQGAVSVAAHPVSTKKLEPQTYFLWNHRFDLAKEFDAWEVASGPVLFDEVKTSGLPMLANSDLHHVSQLRSWKTRINSVAETPAILDAIRRQQLEFTFFKPPVSAQDFRWVKAPLKGQLCS